MRFWKGRIVGWKYAWAPKSTENRKCICVHFTKIKHDVCFISLNYYHGSCRCVILLPWIWKCNFNCVITDFANFMVCKLYTNQHQAGIPHQQSCKLSTTTFNRTISYWYGSLAAAYHSWASKSIVELTIFNGTKIINDYTSHWNKPRRYMS